MIEEGHGNLLTADVDAVAEGTVTAPAEDGLPELMEDLVPEIDSVSDLLLAERASRR